jgi:hypothetical protein
MMTYTSAPYVTTDGGITSAQYNTLATAFNDTLKQGAGDPTWRLWYKVWSIGKQIVDSVDSPNDEWLHSYMHVGPEYTSVFEQNEANPLIRFVMGGFGAEGDQSCNTMSISDVDTPGEMWDLAKQQRGAIDLVYGYEASPSLAAARIFRPVMEFDRMHPWGVNTVNDNYPQYQAGFGGSLPFPDDCTCGSAPVYDEEAFEWVPGVNTVGKTIKFTNLHDNSVLSYTTCLYESGQMIPNGDNLWKVTRYDNNYRLHFYNTGTLDLPYADWIYGPHYGNTLMQRTSQPIMEQIMQAYDSTFRGTEAERANDRYSVKGVAFNFDKFFRTQYYLAPALAQPNPSREIFTFTTDGNTNGEALLDQNGETPSFTPGGTYAVKKIVIDAISGEGFSNAFNVWINDGLTLIATVQMSTDENGDFIGQTYYLDQTIVENISVTSVDTFSSAHTVQISITCEPVISSLTADYPSFGNNQSTLMAPGDFLVMADDSQYYDIPTPTSWSVIGAKIDVGGITFSQSPLTQSSVELELFDNELSTVTPITISLTNNDSHVIMFQNPTTWQSLRVKTNSHISPSTTINVEFAVLRKMMPRIEDAYVLLRMGTTKGGSLDLDGIGFNDSAKTVERNYFRAGCLMGTGEYLPPQVALETNPFYETARRMIKERMRLVKRNHPDTAQAIKGYAVEDGKTVLYFKRFFTISGETFDMFDGIAPPTESVTTIQDGYVYQVSGSAITYNGVTYNHGATFVGVVNVETFTGTGAVRQYEGIVDRAPKRGLTNEWIMHMTECGYKLSGDFQLLTWDQIGFGQNRCHFLSTGIAFTDLCHHAAYDTCPTSGAPLVTSPSAFNYYEFLNDIVGYSEATRGKFFESCMLYPADYKVESATYNETTGEVRLKFTGRFRATPKALLTGSFGRDQGAQALSDEEFRTDENAIRQYLHSQAEGGSQCTLLIGDVAELAGTDTYGSCVPRFMFTKLHPYVRVDLPSDNNTQEWTDTRCLSEELQWMTFVLSAICEGFIDEIGAQTVTSTTCPDRPPLFRYENLMKQAIGMQSMGFFPESDVSNNIVRDDRPTGFGPFPNTRMYVDQFNRLSAAINKLDMVPIELPWAYQHRTRRFFRIEPYGFSNRAGTDSGVGTPCTSSYATGVSHPCSQSNSQFTPEGWTYGEAYGAYDAPPASGTEYSSDSELSWSNGFSIDAGATCGIGIVECPTVGAGQTVLRLACDDAAFSYTRDTRWYYNESRIHTSLATSVWQAVPDALVDNVEMHTSVLGVVNHTEAYLTPHFDTTSGFQVECGGEFGYQWNDNPTFPLTFTGNTQIVIQCEFFNISDGTVLNLRERLEGAGSTGATEQLCPGGYDAWAATDAPIHAGGSNISCGAGGSYKSLDFTPVTDAYSVVRIPRT